jgi:hypothetical protein
VVGHHVADDEAAVVVEEGRHVDAGVAAEEEGENVRLPHLVGFCPLEARLGRRRLGQLHRPVLQEALLVENPPHRRLADAEPLEALEETLDAPGAVLRVLSAHRRHRLAPSVIPRRTARTAG